MTISRINSFWGRWTAWLCLSLMLWIATAESTHQHPNHAGHAPCAICVVAHTANPAPNSAFTIPFFSTIGVLQEEDIPAKAQIDFFDAGIRGPPAL